MEKLDKHFAKDILNKLQLQNISTTTWMTSKMREKFCNNDILYWNGEIMSESKPKRAPDLRRFKSMFVK